MTSRFSELVIDAHEPKRLAEFWCGVLGYHVLDEQPDLIEIGDIGLPAEPTDAYIEEWKARLRAGVAAPTLVFAKVPEGKEVKNRVHIDVSPIDASHPDEVERVLALGAKRVDIGQGDVRWEVLADPEGNEFCILRSIQAAD
jgi:hypothetical protein